MASCSHSSGREPSRAGAGRNRPRPPAGPDRAPPGPTRHRATPAGTGVWHASGTPRSAAAQHRVLAAAARHHGRSHPQGQALDLTRTEMGPILAEAFAVGIACGRKKQGRLPVSFGSWVQDNACHAFSAWITSARGFTYPYQDHGGPHPAAVE